MTRKRIVCIKRPRSARIRTATSRTSASAGARASLEMLPPQISTRSPGARPDTASC